MFTPLSTSLVACIGWVVYFKNSVPSSYIGIKESNMIEYLQKVEGHFKCNRLWMIIFDTLRLLEKGGLRQTSLHVAWEQKLYHFNALVVLFAVTTCTYTCNRDVSERKKTNPYCYVDNLMLFNYSRSKFYLHNKELSFHVYQT